MSDRKPKEWTPEDIAAVKAWEAKQVAAGRCPWSGLLLGAPENGVRRCSICDCNGVAAETLAPVVPTTPSNDPPAADPGTPVPKAEPGPLNDVGPQR